MDGFPPSHTGGGGVWGWGDNQVREERLIPFGDRSLLGFVPPRNRGGYSCLATSWQAQNEKSFDRPNGFVQSGRTASGTFRFKKFLY